MIVPCSHWQSIGIVLIIYIVVDVDVVTIVVSVVAREGIQLPFTAAQSSLVKLAFYLLLPS